MNISLLLQPLIYLVDTPVVFDSKKPTPLVIGTIRMGLGHRHRIAYAACSWATQVDTDNANLPNPATGTTYFHDLLNIDSEEADLIKSTDAVYSKMSRITSNMGGVVEKAWGKAMLSGDGDALRISGLTATHLQPLFKDLPLDTPIIATHCYVARALENAVWQIRSVEKTGGATREMAAECVESCRQVAIEARLTIDWRRVWNQ